MPYIKQSERERAFNSPATSGELNFALTTRIIKAHDNQSTPMALNILKQEFQTLIEFYWTTFQSGGYSTINDILGAIAGSLMEYRRRTQRPSFGPEELRRRMLARAVSNVVDDFYNQIAVPYEREKIKENGDVY